MSEAGSRGRAETEHTVTVAAGICGRSPWMTPVTGSCGCPSRDGPPRPEKARMQRDPLPITPSSLEQYIIISSVGHREAAKDVAAPEPGSRGRAEIEHTVTVAAGICRRSPWTTPVTGSCGCPPRDGHSSGRSARREQQ